MSVPTAVRAGRLLRFDRLDGSGGAFPVYAVGWRIMGNADTWTAKFLNFKNGNPAALAGAKRVLQEAVRDVLADRNWRAQDTALTVALSSSATGFVATSPLAVTGHSVALGTGLDWAPGIFTKTAHRSLHSLSSASSRDNEVKNTYTCVQGPKRQNLIVLDDFATRGSTVSEMRRALAAVGSSLNIAGLVLGKNEGYDYAVANGVTIDNRHIGQQFQRLWP